MKAALVAGPEYTFKDVTGSGATVADVRANQLSASSEDRNLVTLTVGGNDASQEKGYAAQCKATCG